MCRDYFERVSYICFKFDFHIGYLKFKIMSSSRKGLSVYARYRKNPFLREFIEKVGNDKREMRYARTDGIVVSPHGEVLQDGDAILGYRKRVDRGRFIKIYAESLMMFHQLSKRAAMLFIVIMRALEKDQTIITMAPKQMMDIMDCSEPTYYRAVSELLDKRLIARSDYSTVIYFINPAFMFNGDRMTIVRSYEIDHSVEPDDPDGYLSVGNEYRSGGVAGIDVPVVKDMEEVKAIAEGDRERKRKNKESDADMKTFE